MYVPCRKCAECISASRLAWAYRIHREMETWKNPTYFITLTYAEDYLPASGVYPRHIELFHKRLRKSYRALTNNSFRYFLVAEYGSEYGRPHYHALYFNIACSQRRFFKLISDAWNMGECRIRKADSQGGIYAVKDMMCNQLLPDDQKPLFYRRSTKPGLGSLYTPRPSSLPLFDVRRLYAIDTSGKRVPKPRYLLEKEMCPTRLSLLRELRKRDPEYVDAKENQLVRRLGYDALTPGNYEIVKGVAERSFRKMKSKQLRQVVKSEQDGKSSSRNA
ncbi:replication initiator protein [Peromfec virus RodF5_8]|uniref:Replication initiator protein n=1 Tax=Peromfec virus RodF5_8 TaxID=2929344 RepID=A0A976N283_9VIRU|nr:replication initiator protein [Peromfec virus RodF5_8]